MSKSDIAKSIHQRLLNVHKKTGENFNSILTRYGLERILYRIMISNHADSFVLKGAMLYQVWDNIPRRPTRDVDLLGYGKLGHIELSKIINDACNVTIENDDGLNFKTESIITEDIRSDQEYLGTRIRFVAYLNNTRIPIQMDVGVGDAVVPTPNEIVFPTLLDMPAPRLRAYHPVTVIAEKVNAMVVHGYMNSRMKDFYDVYIILNNIDIDDDLLFQAITATFNKRQTIIPEQMPVAFTKGFLEDPVKKNQWKNFLNRSKLSNCELTLSEAGTYISKRLWPLMHDKS